MTNLLNFSDIVSAVALSLPTVITEGAMVEIVYSSFANQKRTTSIMV